MKHTAILDLFYHVDPGGGENGSSTPSSVTLKNFDPSLLPL